ncbi:hypothetical protein M5689_003524 [Euphorbia peplus]|nr:hypothetical protein M5689_003524 [Euphorbia peplus]
MGDTNFQVKWHHGGHVRAHGNYIGGCVEVLGPYDWEKMSRLELLWVIREHFKYKYCGPLYYKRNSQFVEIVQDGDIWDMIKGHNSGDIVELFVEYVDEGAQVLDRAYNNDELASVANMCITPSSSFNESHKEGHQPIEAETNEEERVNEEQQAEEDNDGNLEGKDEQEGDGNSEKEDVRDLEKSDDGSNTTKDELYDVELDDDEASNTDEEVAEIKTTVSSYRRARSRRNRGIGKKEIELREAGPDTGFHDWLKQGNKYDGLLGGDEEYIGSSDVDSFASDAEEEGEVPSRRRHLRIHYDPNCEVVLFELGMVFKCVDQFRDA